MSFLHLDRKGLALSIGLVLALYWPAVFGHRYFFERDVWLYWVPHIEWATRTLASGHLPQWNPFLSFGTPFIADPNFQFFYPPSLLNWILPPGIAYTVLVVGHSILGSVGVFQLLRRRLRSRASALVGAVVFVASGPLVSSATLWHHFSSAMYMPWIVDAFLRLRGARGSIRRLGFLTGLQALVGSADVCLMTGLGLLFLLPLRLPRLRVLLPRLVAALALCVMIAAVQWLPTMILANDAGRSTLDVTARLHWSVSPASFIDFLLPLSGAAHAISGEASFMEERLRLIPWMYLGASTLPLLVLGLRRSPRAAALLLFSVMLSLGRHGPVAPWFSQLPLASMLRFPSKVLWLVALCWAVLTAIGCRELIRRRERPGSAGIVLGLSMLLVSFALVLLNPSATTDSRDFQQIGGSLAWAPFALGSLLLAASLGRRTGAAVAFVVIADLVGVGQSLNAYASGDIFATRPAIADTLTRAGARRIFVFQASRTESVFWKVPPGWTEEEAYYFGQGQFMLPPQSVRWSIKGSFDGDFTGLARREYSALSAAAGQVKPIEPLLRLVGVTHAIRFPGAGAPELPVVAQVPTFHDRPVLVFQIPDPLPPAYVVPTIKLEPSMAEVIAALSDPAFDPSKAVVRLSEKNGRQSPSSPNPGTSAARVESDSGGRVAIRASLNAPGTLVVLNAFSKGWHARVDGKPADLLPANLIFQSVDLQAGDHRIEIEYETPGLRLGMLLSLLAWAWLGFMLTVPRLSSKASRSLLP